MDQVVHFEMPVDDVERARGLYGTVFEWGHADGRRRLHARPHHAC
jgi:predicted enzyme related to lactoylglutathione lyase